MSIIFKLATCLGRRDEEPNQQLAQQIVKANDQKAVKELMEGLAGKNKDIQSDCIKTLYEIGELNPKLIAPHADDFIKLLDSKNNRLQWGAMSALNRITAENPKPIYAALSKLDDAAQKGSVITKDNYVGILAKLGTFKEYHSTVLPLLNEQLLKAAVNQLPAYAEQALTVADKKHAPNLAKTINLRLKDIDQESKVKRLEKVLKKLAAM